MTMGVWTRSGVMRDVMARNAGAGAVTGMTRMTGMTMCIVAMTEIAMTVVTMCAIAIAMATQPTYRHSREANPAKGESGDIYIHRSLLPQY